MPGQWGTDHHQELELGLLELTGVLAFGFLDATWDTQNVGARGPWVLTGTLQNIP